MAPRRRAARPRVVVAEAHAKLNLGLAVGPRRPDGFHDLATIFQSVSLHDTLIAERAGRGFTLRVRHEDASLPRKGRWRPRRPAAVPGGRTNLVLRAARAVAERFGLEGGARFTLVKRIPSRAGLGGGSADAAATLAALARLYAIRAPRSIWDALALELGSDVPFARRGGTALGLGRGEKLTPLRLERAFDALIAMPAWHVSTARAFARIDRNRLTLTTWRAQLRFAHDFVRKPVKPLRALRMGNTFEGVLEARQSDHDQLRARLLAAGAAEVRMTGSGSALFAIPGSDASVMDVAGRFAGNETLYAVRSTRAGVRLRMQP